MELLKKFHSTYPEEMAFKEELISFVQSHEDCFERTLSIGHVTGSAWIVNSDYNKALLTHHNKLDRWLQLGGHADGDSDIVAVALREAMEESGLRSLKLVSSTIFDIDIHTIPARKDDLEHKHYDVRFLFQADDVEQFHVSSESKSLEWIPFGSLSVYTQHNKSILRMAEKSVKR